MYTRCTLLHVDLPLDLYTYPTQTHQYNHKCSFNQGLCISPLLHTVSDSALRYINLVELELTLRIPTDSRTCDPYVYVIFIVSCSRYRLFLCYLLQSSLV